ncbi:MAG: acyltransferase family protein [Brevundimonas sp.]
MKRIECLDGLRGAAAMWVMFGHVAILTGVGIPLLSTPDYAVDLFMLLSGFLMVFHHGADDWSRFETTGRFWTKRIFRIAPLYYVLLAAALILAPTLGEMRATIIAATEGGGTVDARYSDQSLTNILMHVSFLFGALPEYAYRTPLPDWSIGLEMMFYAFFPVLMLLGNRIGIGVLAIVATAACWVAVLIFPDFFGAFQQPAILVLKLNVFLAGMLVARSMQLTGMGRAIHLAIGFVVALAPISSPLGLQSLAIHAVLFSVFAVLVDHERHWGRGITSHVSRALGSPLARLLGDISYGVYLLHLLIVIPLAAFAASRIQADGLRFIVVSAVSGSIVCAVAYMLHLTVERPGITAGRTFIARFFGRLHGRQITT